MAKVSNEQRAETAAKNCYADIQKRRFFPVVVFYRFRGCSEVPVLFRLQSDKAEFEIQDNVHEFVGTYTKEVTKERLYLDFLEHINER